MVDNMPMPCKETKTALEQKVGIIAPIIELFGLNVPVLFTMVFSQENTTQR
jgi:hypothetical protein